jgi:hypothetical protein
MKGGKGLKIYHYNNLQEVRPACNQQPYLLLSVL